MERVFPSLLFQRVRQDRDHKSYRWDCILSKRIVENDSPPEILRWTDRSWQTGPLWRRSSVILAKRSRRSPSPNRPIAEISQADSACYRTFCTLPQIFARLGTTHCERTAGIAFLGTHRELFSTRPSAWH